MGQCGAVSLHMTDKYERGIATFALIGADLINEDISLRYGGLVPVNPERPLEPGFAPPRRRPKIITVSHYPNDGDLRSKVRDYNALRENFKRWGSDRTIETYRAAYADWLDSVPVIPFHISHTLPVLNALGIAPDEIAWLPLVKAPMRPESKPRMFIVQKDRPVTMGQLKLLTPLVVWVQGVVAHHRVGAQIRETITQRIVKHNVSPWRSAQSKHEEIDRVVEELKKSLGR
jgi:hypothetical protein